MQQQENTLQIITIVQGNLLQLAIPLQREIVSLVDSQVDISYENFVPTGPVTVVLACGNFANKYRATMDSELTNVAHIEDNGTLPVGVYSITILCRDENAKRMRYKKRAVVNVVDTTAEAGIEPGTEFAVGTQWLSAAVFLAMGSGGGGIGEETDPVFSVSPAAGITQAIIDYWNAKQEAIADLGQIRAGAAAGATALQPGALAGYATEDYVIGIRQRIESLIDTLIGTHDATSAIDTFNEIVAFLDSVEDTETLAGIIAGLNTSIAGKVDKVTGKGLSTNDFTTTLLNKLNLIEDGAQVNVINGINKHDGTPLNPDNNGIVTLPEQTEVDMTDYYDKDEVDDRISQMEATIEQQQLTVITGDRLSLWLDEDGESINIMAGEVPDIAAAPTISHTIVNDVSSVDNGKATVTIATTEQGATIYYTTNGDTPTESSSVYSSALTFDTAGTYTIKAIAVIQDKMNSSVVTDTFSVVSCQTPTIAVDNTARNTATITATAGTGESVSLSVDGQTATGTGSASVTINKTTSSQTLSASATATATGKLTATATQNVTIEEKQGYVFGDYELGGKAADASVPIEVTTTEAQNVTFETVDGVVYWKVNLQGKIPADATELTLKNGVNSSNSIFTSGATNVLTIEHIPINVKKINSANAFSACTALTKFKTSGESELYSVNNAFKSLTALVEVSLPSTVMTLNLTFDGCTALESVSAPGVTTVTNSAFRNCSSLTTASFGTITIVGDNAFNGCSSFDFAGLDFSHATTIGSSAFKSCTGLTSIDLSSATSIGSAAFQSAGLTSLTLGDSLTTIGGTAFYACKMTSVDIPASVTSIGGSAFESSTYMKEFHIKKVIASSSEAATVSGSGLNKPSNNPAIYVPVGTATYYQAAWTAYASLIVEESNS